MRFCYLANRSLREHSNRCYGVRRGNQPFPQAFNSLSLMLHCMTHPIMTNEQIDEYLYARHKRFLYISSISLGNDKPFFSDKNDTGSKQFQADFSSFSTLSVSEDIHSMIWLDNTLSMNIVEHYFTRIFQNVSDKTKMETFRVKITTQMNDSQHKFVRLTRLFCQSKLIYVYDSRNHIIQDEKE